MRMNALIGVRKKKRGEKVEWKSENKQYELIK